MLNFDSHVHTAYCGHAQNMSIPEIVNQVESLQLDNILITEHVFSDADVGLLEKIRSDLSCLNYDTEILVGFEVDVDPQKTDGSFVTSNEMLQKADLIMGAVHYTPGVGNYPRSPEDNPLGSEKLLKDWRSTLLGMLENPIVEILAHPARLPAAAIEMEIFYDDVIAILKEAAQISARNNVAWEINNLTCARLSKPVFERWHQTIQTAIDAGVKITYGSDAHDPTEINTQGYVSQMLDKLKNFPGFTTPTELMKEKNVSKK